MPWIAKDGRNTGSLEVRFGSLADIMRGVRAMSALPLKADIGQCEWHVRLVPVTDIFVGDQ